MSLFVTVVVSVICVILRDTVSSAGLAKPPTPTNLSSQIVTGIVPTRVILLWYALHATRTTVEVLVTVDRQLKFHGNAFARESETFPVVVLRRWPWLYCRKRYVLFKTLYEVIVGEAVFIPYLQFQLNISLQNT